MLASATGAGERIGHEGRAVHEDAGLAGPRCPRRPRWLASVAARRQVAAGQRLAEAQDVRRDARVLAGEEPPGAAEAGGDLVGDQEHVVPSQSPRTPRR